MNKFLSTLFFLFFTFGANAQLSVGKVYFEKDKSDVLEIQFNEINAKLKQLQFDTLYIHGRTDVDGNSEYNYALSKRRVEAVKSMLYLPIDVVVMEIYLGETSPINLQQNEDEKSLNRFVEIICLPKETGLSTSDLISKDFHEKLQVFSTIYDSSEIQSVKGNTNSDIQFTGKKGTKVHIPAGFLLNEKGEVIANKDVEIRFVEIRTIADMILFNATTHSDSQLLETAGMVYIQAYVDGKPIENFNKEQSTTITFKGTPEKMQNMQLFVGNDPNHLHSEATKKERRYRNGVNWSPVGSPTALGRDSTWNKAYSPNTFNVAPRFQKRTKSKFIGIKITFLDRFRKAVVRVGKNSYFNPEKIQINPSDKTEGASWTLPDSFRTGNGSMIGYDLGVGLQVKTLGWINCDRFLAKGYILATVKISSNGGTSFAILPQYKSIMPEMGNSFPNLPVGKKITVITYSIDKNRVLFYKIDTIIKLSQKIELGDPLNISIEEFKNILNSMI